MLPVGMSFSKRVALNKEIEKYIINTPFKVLEHFSKIKTSFGSKGPPRSLINNYKAVLGTHLPAATHRVPPLHAPVAQHSSRPSRTHGRLSQLPSAITPIHLPLRLRSH